MISGVTDKIIFIVIIFFIICSLFSYVLGAENKENEILANRNRKKKRERIEDIDKVKEEIKKGNL